MPTSVVVAAVGATISGTIAAGTLAFSWGSFAASMVMSGLSAALSEKPKQQSAVSNLSNDGRTVTVQQAISPWQIVIGRARAGGVVTYKKVTNNNSRYHMVVTFAGHVCESIDEIWFDDEVVTFDVDGNATGKYAGYVRIKKSLGDEAGQPFPDLVTESDGEWSDAHRQTGRTKVYFRITANNDLFPTGLPNITAIIKGAKFFDPRSGLTAWTDNPALAVNGYLTHPQWGLNADYAVEINQDDLIAAANICDETVALASGGTEPRYTCNGVFTLSEKPADIIGKLSSAMAGYTVQIGASWNILAGAYETPTIELGAGDLSGQIQFTTLTSRRDNCNAVKGLFVSPENKYQATDFPAVKPDSLLAEDGGRRSWHDLQLNFTNSGTMAQRLAKIELLRTRQGLTVKWPGKLGCFRAQPGRTVLLTFEKYGWNQKPFFVQEGTFSVNSDGTLGYSLSLRETAPEVYDWTISDEQLVAISPNTDLGSPFTVGIPGTPAITEAKYQTTGSAGVKSRADISWANADDGFVIDYLPEYRADGADWIALPATPDSFASVFDLAPGYYEFRVRSRNALGARSSYSGITRKEILGLTDLPANVTNLTVVASNGQATGKWDLSPDLDVRIGGRAVLRWTPMTTGAQWENGIPVGEFNGDATTGQLPMLTGTYLAKFKDSTGNWSTGTASWGLTAGSLTALPNSQTLTEHTAWAGSSSGTVVVAGSLQLDAAVPIDSVATLVDTWGMLDSLGGVNSAGTYDFATLMDFGSVGTRRFTANIQALAFDTGDYIDVRGPVDDWDSVDGLAINDATVTLQAALSQDGSTYSAWFPFMAGDFTSRSAKFRLQLASAQPTHNVGVSQLSVTANW